MKRGTGGPLCAVESRRDAPNTTLPGAQFPLFLGRVLHKAVRGIGYDRVNGIRFPLSEPVEAIRLHQRRVPVADGRKDWDRLLAVVVRVAGLRFQPGQPVDTTYITHEQTGRVEAQVRTNTRCGNVADDVTGAVYNLGDGSAGGMFLEHGQYGVAHLTRRSPGSGCFGHADTVDVPTSSFKIP